MADNAVLNSGSGGITLALDEISGVHHQRVKIQHGADGSATDVSAASPLPVDGSGVTLTVAAHAVTNAGTFAVQVDGDALTALQLLDDVVYVDDAAFTLGTSKGIVMMGFAGTQSVDANDAAALACDTDGALHISDGGNSLTVDNGGTFAVQVDAALPAGTNAIGKLAENSGVDIGDVDVLSIAAGANLVGDVGISGARTSGGTTIFRSIDLDETEEEVKGSAGQIYWIHAMNLASSPRYLKVYNATAASVVVGTTPPVMTFPLASSGDTNGAGFVLAIPNGIALGTAITVAATTAIADNDTGAPGANEVVVNIGYA